MQGLTKLAPFVGILSLIIAWLIYNYVKKQPNGNALMADWKNKSTSAP
jgi:K(+)-stimulated pyrophosphate-energized sodium pump